MSAHGSASRRLGVMGGTFDPIHHGHLVVAEEARTTFGLEEVVFLPAGAPWQKSHRVVSSPEDRLAMCLIATATNPHFSVSRRELDREGPTYTVDTLRALRAETSGQAELFFITGADAVSQILTWKDAEETLSLATFIAATRPGTDRTSVDALPAAVRDRIEILDAPGVAISSTLVRQRVSEGRSIRYLVPGGVASYIAKRRLYRPE